MTRALLLIDIQNDYFPGGAMELDGAAAAGQRAGRLLSACRTQGMAVIHVQHLSLRPGASFFIPGSPGVEINAAVTPLPDETVVRKNFPNSFRQTTLLATLRACSVTELVVAGMMTHMCIDTTVRAAADLGFVCQLAHDACATRALDFGGRTIAAADVHAAYLAGLNGAFAGVRSTDEIIAGL